MSCVRALIPGAVIAGCLSVVTMVGSTGPVAAIGSSVSGTVFQDFNANGVMNTTVALGTAFDVGVAGITVRAFDTTGAEVGSTTTAANGTWTIDVTSAPTNDVRVEFSIPENDPYLSAFRPAAPVITTGAAGSSTGTSIQFARKGNTGVNFGVNVPGEYCQSNPNIAITQGCNGVGAAAQASPTVYVTAYDGSPKVFYDLYSDRTYSKAAQASETGSIYGTAWNPGSRRILTSAFVRRAERMYQRNGVPLPGALFSTTPDSTKYSAPADAGGTTAFLVDLETLLPGDQFSNTTPPPTGIANAGFTGYIPTNSARGLDTDNENADSDIPADTDGVYEEVGKTGIGDITVDETGNLWVVSLYTRHLYKVVMPSNGSAPTTMTDEGSIVGTVSCTNGTARPFGVTVFRGSVYLPVTCDGSGDYDASKLTALTTGANITYSIVRYEPASNGWSNFFGPRALNNGTNPVRGYPWQTAPAFTRVWHPWTDKFTMGWWVYTGQEWWLDYPMPLASGLQFDRNGSMIVALRNRGADMAMSIGTVSPAGNYQAGQGMTPGDLIRICRTGPGWTAADFTYQQAGNAACNARYGNWTGTTTDDEYYWDEFGLYGGSALHADIAGGSVLQLPGFPEVLNTSIDAAYQGSSWNSYGVRTGGVAYYLNFAVGTAQSGSRQSAVSAGGFNVYGSLYGPNSAGSFSKTMGMGDLAALCDLAPVQIGNRLWVDTDGDGIQDPDESPIAGVTVRLYDSNGVLVGTAVTNSKGEYYFSSAVTEAANGGSTPDAVGGNLQRGVAYTIRLDNPADYASGGPLEGYVPTTAGATTATTGDLETSIDSNAALGGSGTAYGFNSFPRMSVPALAAGTNDMSFDVGFLEAVAVGDYVWIDADGDGVQDAGELPLPGVKVALLDTNGDPVTGADGTPLTATTDVNGYYVFDRISPGDYRMQFVLPDGYAFTTQGSGAGASDSNPDRVTGITPVFTVTLGVDPTSGTVADTDASTIAAFVNPTIDAGVVPVVSIGDYVWFDTNNDGVQDPSDVPLQGVKLVLVDLSDNPVLDAFGNPVEPVYTDANGFYEFKNLPVGAYKVIATTPLGLSPVSPGVGGDDSVDSSTGSATSANLTEPGASDRSLDFGFWAPYPPPVSLGDRVWLDTDGDGVQDPGELGIAGATLTLTDPFGNPVTDVLGNPVGPITTGADGAYFFEGLPAGQYQVHITYPPGYGPTTAEAGEDTSADSSTTTATSVVLTPGQHDLSLDFGVVPVVSLGDFVWLDADNDGTQDPGEPGIAGVELSLLDAAGNPVLDGSGSPVKATTDENGEYRFENLPYGTYRVSVAPPAGFTATTPTTATSASLDTPGEADLSLDFGFYAPRVSVGDYVWLDADVNGLQDASDIPLANVKLTITNLDGDPVEDIFGNTVGPEYTDASGHYLFDNLPPGRYRVTITAPDGLFPTTENNGDGTNDSSSDYADSVNLPNNGDSDPNLDFGLYVPPPAIGNYVWVDTNLDGIQAPGEPGLAGVVLALFEADGVTPVLDGGGNPVTTTTDTTGFYAFADLAFQSYTVKITYPSGYAPTKTGAGTSATDSSTNSATSAVLSLLAPVDMTLDFGVVPMVSLGDFVWVDTDRDGLQDAGEPGIPGVTLALQYADGTPVLDASSNPVTTTTNGDGEYLFENLPPGVYKVVITPPAGYVPTVSTGGTGAEDSSTGSALSMLLDDPNEHDPTLDFGFVLPAVSVGNFVWLDLNRDGIQDPSEEGIAGVELGIVDAATGLPVTDVNGDPVGTVLTDKDGFYLFDKLPPGQYRVSVVTPPDGLIPTVTGAGDKATDSSTDSATSRSLLTNSEDDPTLDFGFVVPSVSVGDYVWIDSNRDGIQQGSESGITGITLSIKNADGSNVYDVFGDPVTTTTTNALGAYLFENLPPGTYVVSVDTPPAGYVPTKAEQGADTTADSSTGSATSAALTDDGSSDRSLDFGFVLPALGVGDFVWIDLDKDGVQDTTEPPLPGVKVELLNPDGTPALDLLGYPVPSTFTDVNGYYFFDSLAPGDYQIRFTLPDGYGFTAQAAGTDPEVDANPDPATGLTPVFTLADSAGVGNTVEDTDPETSAILVDPTIDAGVIAPVVAVGDYVWRDDNLDGLQTAGEPPLKGVKVELFDASGAPAMDADGNPVAAVYTDASGKYFIDNLIPGTYYIVFTPPTGYDFTGQMVGSNTGKDSNPDATGRTPDFTIGAVAGGTTSADTDPATKATLVNPTIDAGLVQPEVGVGDFVWVDTDKDGIQDPNEPVLEGVLVQLLNADGTLARDADGNLVLPEYTDDNGFYFFDNLRPGDYRMQFLLPAGYTFTTDNPAAGGTGDNDSNPNPMSGLTPVFTIEGAVKGDTVLATDYPDLPAGAEAVLVNPTIDAGVISPVVAVGNYTWIDRDADGVQDIGEPALAGVKVELFDAAGNPATDYDGNPVPPVYTNAQGYYLFDNLLPGDYTIKFTGPSGYVLTIDEPGAAGTVGNDSNPDPSTGWTPEFSIGPVIAGTTVSDTDPATKATLVNPSIDAGFVAPVVAMGDFTWIDTDKDEIQDPSEPVLAGVLVQLLNADGTIAHHVDGTPVAPVYTDANGYYFVDDLLPGDYRAQFVLPAGYAFTGDLSGADRALDSNPNPTTGLTPVFTIAATATGDTVVDTDPSTDAVLVNPTIDAGVIAPVVAIGNYTWIDADQDGVQDKGELPLEGVKVELFNPDGSPATDYHGNPVPAVYTDEDGFYVFDNLLPGDYRVTFSAPDGFDLTDDGGGSVSKDSDPDPETGETPVFRINPIPSGNTVYDTDTDTVAQLVNPTIDAGFVPVVAVGDYTWVDSDRDGIQDDTESPIAGMKVSLYAADGVTPAVDADGNPIGFVTTDANGFYLFDNLLPGDYTIRFEPPAGYAFTQDGAGTDGSVDSNASDSTAGGAYGWTSAFTINPDASGDTIAAADYTDAPAGMIARFVNPTVDAGVVPLAAVGDFTWLDSDRDGLQDIGEPKLAGVVVKLYDPVTKTQALDAYGNLAQATTDANGFYFIDDLFPGDYYATFTLPDPGHYRFTAPGVTNSITPSGNGSNPIGYASPETRVSTPATGDDSNPDRYSGVTPTFTVAASATGDTVAAASTTLPAGGADALFVNPTIDAGIVPIVAISNYYWFDDDRDGTREPTELPVVGGKVELLNPDGTPATDADGNPVPPVNADENGYFLFDNLIPGDYKLRFTPPPGYVFTKKGSGGALDDSNTNPDGVTDTFSVEPIVTGNTVDETTEPIKALKWNPTVGAGLVPIVAVGDYVWFDTDGDGLQDRGEEPAHNALVRLVNPDGTPALDADGIPVAEVRTDARGRYLFDNLLPGSYRVQFPTPLGYLLTTNLGGDDTTDSDADTLSGLTDVFTIYGRATGNTIADTDPATKALFVDPTIDAGYVEAELPPTGSDPYPMWWIALCLLLAGAALHLTTRRCGRDATTSVR